MSSVTVDFAPMKARRIGPADRRAAAGACRRQPGPKPLDNARAKT